MDNSRSKMICHSRGRGHALDDPLWQCGCGSVFTGHGLKPAEKIEKVVAQC